jgi:2-amino-4-hydroxy-6-hydroxymethyldihydropteridine diphosphokinase
MACVYIGLGSNIGDSKAMLVRAIEGLEAVGLVMQTSRFYRTEPVGVLDQAWFVNAVACIQTNLAPEELLRTLKTLEKTLGRVDGVRFGPRVIDMDILFYDKLVMQSETLTIPHPRLQERRFVLVPLAEIAPELMHPLFHVSIAELLQNTKDTSVVGSL